MDSTKDSDQLLGRVQPMEENASISQDSASESASLDLPTTSERAWMMKLRPIEGTFSQLSVNYQKSLSFLVRDALVDISGNEIVNLLKKVLKPNEINALVTPENGSTQPTPEFIIKNVSIKEEIKSEHEEDFSQLSYLSDFNAMLEADRFCTVIGSSQESNSTILSNTTYDPECLSRKSLISSPISPVRRKSTSPIAPVPTKKANLVMNGGTNVDIAKRNLNPSLNQLSSDQNMIFDDDSDEMEIQEPSDTEEGSGSQSLLINVPEGVYDVKDHRRFSQESIETTVAPPNLEEDVTSENEDEFNRELMGFGDDANEERFVSGLRRLHPTLEDYSEEDVYEKLEFLGSKVERPDCPCNSFICTDFTFKWVFQCDLIPNTKLEMGKRCVKHFVEKSHHRQKELFRYLYYGLFKGVAMIYVGPSKSRIRFEISRLWRKRFMKYIANDLILPYSKNKNLMFFQSYGKALDIRRKYVVRFQAFVLENRTLELHIISANCEDKNRRDLQTTMDDYFHPVV